MYRNIRNRLVIALVATSISACVVASPPIEHTSQVVVTPVQGLLSVGVNQAPPVGQVIPVNVSIANGTDFTRTVVPNQIFAINQSGERVAPLPPGEAARQAGGAGELKAALESGAVSGVAGGAVGAGLGAGVGAAGDGIGAGFGGVTGGVG